MTKSKECVNSKCKNIFYVPSSKLHLPLICEECQERSKSMKTTVTLFRYYSKSVVIEIDTEKTERLTSEEIASGLMDGTIPYDEEKVYNDAHFKQREVTPEGVETDRYDVYDEEGNQIYGGHL